MDPIGYIYIYTESYTSLCETLRWFMFQNSNFEPKVREDHLKICVEETLMEYMISRFFRATRGKQSFNTRLTQEGIDLEKHLTLRLEVQLGFWKFPVLPTCFLPNSLHGWPDFFCNFLVGRFWILSQPAFLRIKWKSWCTECVLTRWWWVIRTGNICMPFFLSGDENTLRVSKIYVNEPR